MQIQKENIELDRFLETEVQDYRSQALYKLSYFLVGITWLSNFRIWMPINARFLPSFLVLLLTCLLVFHYRNKKPRVAALIFVMGLMGAILADLLLIRNGLLGFLFIIPIFITGIIIGPLAVTIVGVFSCLFVFSTNLYLLFQSNQETLFLLLGSTTVLAWFQAAQVHSNMSQVVQYAYLARQALNEARDQQGKLARALRSLDESNSRLVKAYEVIASAQNEAYRATRSKLRFINLISHEFRAPLNFVIGIIDLIVNP